MCSPAGLLGSSTGAMGAPKPALAWGMAVKRVFRNEVPRGPVEKRGSDEAGSATQPVAPFAEVKVASYTSAKPRPHRTHALGDRALPDLMADPNAADSPGTGRSGLWRVPCYALSRYAVGEPPGSEHTKATARKERGCVGSFMNWGTATRSTSIHHRACGFD